MLYTERTLLNINYYGWTRIPVRSIYILFIRFALNVEQEQYHQQSVYRNVANFCIQQS